MLAKTSNLKLRLMLSLNRAHIIGFVTETPEIRQTPSGANVTDLNIEIRTKNEGNSEKAMISTFLTVTLWRGLADVAGQYVQKGSEVFVAGRLETDSWEDEQGQKRSRTKLVGDDLILLTAKSGPLPSLSEGLSIQGGINKVEVLGNVTRDPELKTTPNGNMVTSFGVATNRQWKDNSGETQDRTEFHNIVVWGNLAEEISRHITKGRKVYITGRLQNRSWETPDGQKRYTTEIVANEVKSLGHAHALLSGETSYTATETTSATSTAGAAIPEINYESEIKPEDLPF